jgi:hypothetical protein
MDLEIGMMLAGLGRRHHPLHEGHGLGETLELEVLADFLAVAGPAGDLGQFRLDVGVAQ